MFLLCPFVLPPLLWQVTLPLFVCRMGFPSQVWWHELNTISLMVFIFFHFLPVQKTTYVWCVSIVSHVFFMFPCVFPCFFHSFPTFSVLFPYVFPTFPQKNLWGRSPQVGGGGCAEDALVDLTGGVAGRFYTADARAPRTYLLRWWSSPVMFVGLS